MWPEALPNLHAAVVHFPVALLPLAVLVDLVSLAPRRTAWRVVSRWLWVGLAVATTVVWFAGRQAADGLVGVQPAALAAIGRHADAAWRLLLLTWGVVVLRETACWIVAGGRSRLLGPARWSSVGLGVVALVQLVQTADRGGALVYRHGVAVVAASRSEPSSLQAPSLSVLPAVRDGQVLVPHGETVVWAPQPGDLEQLDPGPVFLAKTKPVELPSMGVRLSVSGRHALLLPGTYGDVHLNAWLDLSGFEGAVALVHHVTDDQAGAFQWTTDGRGSLRVLGSGADTLDEGIAAGAGRVALSVSTAGTHLKGLVDGRLLVHGHADAPSEGRWGLVFDGEGVVGVERVDLTPLDAP